MKRFIKVSTISVKIFIKNLRRFETFEKKFERIGLNFVTVVESSIQEMIWFVESVLIFGAKFECC